MTKTERIEIRVTEEMKQQLQTLAKAENRTISNIIEEQLIQVLRERGMYIIGSKSHFKSL
ncbi:MAG: ribbon-helix-helix protein, CopG family [Bacillota bacterium]|jgi:predicted transcriptional regulator